MEQTVNQFSKGLQMDTHPMVLGNDTLSDALNATFVTMNGNEVILQNDMGNRRIDNACLPSGYEPVGIKEYGGIIYIACYNPLTGRGQVGSFPSPERKKSNTDNKVTQLNFLSFFSEPDNNGLRSILRDSISLKLTEDVLHTGDKFYFKSDTINNYIQYLTPKIVNNLLLNNLFTLQIGVFNSLNLFIDISELLKTYQISLGENQGSVSYFISTEFPNESLEESSDDANFIENRLKLDWNVYSLKLVSPLYLKATVNYIKNYSFEVNGSTTNGNLTVFVNATYEYNCPVSEFPIRFTYSSNNEEIITEYSNIQTNIINTTYNESTDSWTTLVRYIITVGSEYDNDFNYTIESLLEPITDTFGSIVTNSYNGHLDISQLGNDTLSFSGWRYYNSVSERKSELTFEIEAYPKYNESNLKAIYLYFKDKDTLVENSVIPLIENYEEGIRGGGVHVILFDWPEALEERKLYNCYLVAVKNITDPVITSKPDNLDVVNKTITSESKISYQELNSEPYWFLTTELFNSNYDGTETFNEEDTSEYAYIGSNVSCNYLKKNEAGEIEEIYYSYDEHLGIFIEDFTKIKRILLRPYLNFSSSNNTDPLTTSIINKLVENVTPEYSFTTNFNLWSKIYFNIYIENEELYPEETSSIIKIQNSGVNLINNTEKISYDEYESLAKANENLREIINYPIENLKDVISLNNFIISNPTNFEELGKYTFKTFNLNIDINDFIIGNPITTNISCNNVITSLKDFVKNNGLLEISTPRFCIDNENSSYFSINYIESTAEDPTNKSHTYERRLLGTPAYYSDNKEIINSYFNQFSSSGIFVGEINSDDWVIWHYNYNIDKLFKTNPNSGNNFSTKKLTYGSGNLTDNVDTPYKAHKAYKRIWLKINLKEYFPILTQEVFAEDSNDKIDTVTEKSMLVDFGDIDDSLMEVLEYIPHYYVYKVENNSFSITNILNINSCYKSKEFNIPIYVTFDYQITPGTFGFISDYKNTNIYGIDEKYFKNLILTEKLVIGNVYSNSDFLDILESITSYEFDTVAKLGGDIKLFDNQNQFFDKEYIYYWNNYLSLFVKWYIPKDKYTIAPNLYLPSLTYNGILNMPTEKYVYSDSDSTTLENAVDGHPTTYKGPVPAVFVLREYHNSKIEDFKKTLFFDELPNIFKTPAT